MMFKLEIAGRSRRVEIVRSAGSDRIAGTLDGERFEVDARLLQAGVLSLVVEGKAYRCILDEAAGGERAVLVGGKRFVFAAEDPRSLRSRRGAGASEAGPKAIKAPMPGRVVRVMAAVGEEVAAQQGVVVIEAMKMQNELKSPKAGKLVRLGVQVGDTVQTGEVLAVVE